MNQSSPLYDMASTLETLEPWLEQHLPSLDPVARAHFTHLVVGIIEQHSLLVGAIAAASPFQAEPESNYTQVQRIIRDTRLSLESVYYPLLEQLLAALPDEEFFVTVDQTNHGKDFNLVLVGLATDGVSLPLGFLVYAPDEAWADEARLLLTRLDAVIPSDRTVTLLADRGHAGDPFVRCLDALNWSYVIRLPEATWIETQREGWSELRHLRQRRDQLRVFANVRIWKGSTRRATVCLYRTRAANGKLTTWYLLTNLEGERTRFFEYACRWWQECTHKLLKSALFEWERGRVLKPARVAVLLMGFGCACWALWLLGRSKERVSTRKPRTTRTQLRRQNIIKRGWDVLQAARKRRTMPTLPAPPALRVLTYQRRFPGFRQSCDAAFVELW
jgi:Transposase DDE domain